MNKMPYSLALDFEFVILLEVWLSTIWIESKIINTTLSCCLETLISLKKGEKMPLYEWQVTTSSLPSHTIKMSNTSSFYLAISFWGRLLKISRTRRMGSSIQIGKLHTKSLTRWKRSLPRFKASSETLEFQLKEILQVILQFTQFLYLTTSH